MREGSSTSPNLEVQAWWGSSAGADVCKGKKGQGTNETSSESLSPDELGDGKWG